MIRAGALSLWLLASTPGVSSPQVDASLRYRAAPDPNTRTLIASARLQPDSVREAISRAFKAAATDSNRGRSTHLVLARRLAEAYATAWSDSFFIVDVRRFSSASPAQRQARVEADSLRRAGNAAIGIEGAPAAMRLWRASERRAKSLGDRAAIAPALLSIGAGFYRLGQLDSAVAYVKSAERLGSEIGDRRTVGNAIGILASVSRDRGKLRDAEALYRRASEVRALSGDTRGIAADANNLGSIAEERGDFAQAQAAYGRALELNRRDGRSALAALNLSNLAGMAANMGNYRGAESHYRGALALNRKTGQRAEEAFILHGLGKVYMNLGDYRRAQESLEEALRVHDSSGAAREAIEVRVDLASVESALGNPETARSVLEDAVNAARTAKIDPATQASLALAQADLAIQFGTFVDAETHYSRAVRLYRLADDSMGLARGIEGQAFLKHARGDDALALALLGDAARIQIANGNRRGALLTGLVTADVQIARRDFAGARRTLIAAHDGLRRLGDVVGEASALAGLGDLSLQEGKIGAAVASYQSGIGRLGRRKSSEVFWRLHTGLGEALRVKGSLAESANEFRIAITATENTAAGFKLDERRSGFLADRWAAYTNLALVELARGNAGAAFAVSEQLRARQMLGLLARGRVARAMPSTEEQDLKRTISFLSAQIETDEFAARSVRDPQFTNAAANATRARLDSAHKDYANLLVRLREKDPAYAALVSGKTRSWRDVASQLKPDQVFLEYLLSDSASTLFVITPDTVDAIDLRVTRQSLTDLVEFARKTIDPPSTSRSTELWRIPLRRLYLTLIEPAAKKGYLRGRRTLIIAPHGELHFLSFAALIAPGAGDKFLINNFQIGYTPSATVWMQLGERSFGHVSNRVLALAPKVDRLPGTRREAMSIGRIYGPNAVVRLGTSATSRTLREALPGVGTVHLATFGVLNKRNPLFSFIELAPHGEDDGRLEVDEVFGLALSGQLVILSACQTALGSGAAADVPPGDDWVGLMQAFLQTGASNVVASLWPVEDRATGELMEQLHARLAAGATPVTALAEAQRSLIRKGDTAHPLYWAGFTVSGRSK